MYVWVSERGSEGFALQYAAVVENCTTRPCARCVEVCLQCARQIGLHNESVCKSFFGIVLTSGALPRKRGGNNVHVVSIDLTYGYSVD